ncbi:MAG: tetratricopeptide repeat protein [Acidobacteria bacterium]|nr:tetratricopeptide repeat protein [Acidobacteriota bacterium]
MTARAAAAAGRGAEFRRQVRDGRAQALSSRTGASGFRLRSQPASSVYLNGEWRGRCDEQGDFTLGDLPAGPYRLRVRKAGYLEASRVIRLPRPRSAILSLRLTRDPDPLAGRYQQGEDFRENRKHDEAIEAYSAVIEEGKANPRLQTQSLIGRARCYAAQGRLEEAFEDSQIASGTASAAGIEGQTVMANVLRSQGQYEEAADAYRKALRRAKDFSPEAHTGLGITLDELDQPEAALGHFRAAIRQDGDAQPILYYLLGNALTRLERNPEAIRAYERFLSTAPNSKLVPAVESLLENLKD